MSSFGQVEIETGDKTPDTFAPSGLDVDQWLDAIPGINYAILTTKHHDGFALWPTNHRAAGHVPYSIAATTWYANNGRPDVTKLFVDGCRARGINPVLYFSMVDYTHEAQTGTTAWTDTAAYLDLIETQITELLTFYGPITALWLDAWTNWGYDTIFPVDRIYHLIKRLQPNCLMLNNGTSGVQPYSEIDIYDGITPPNDATLKEQGYLARVAPGTTWFYHSAADQTGAAWQSAATVNANIATVIARNSAVAVDIQPGTDGHLTAAQVALLAGLHA